MPRTSCRAASVLTAAVLFALPLTALAQGVPVPPPGGAAADTVPPAGPPVPPPPPPPPVPWVVPEQPAPLPPPQVAPPAPPVDGPLLSPFAGAPWASPTVGHVPYSAAYRITWLPDESVHGQPTNFGLVQHDASVRAPIWQDECDEFSATAHVRAEIINTGAILPNTGQPFPDELWDVRFGATYRHLFENGWIAGGGFNFGSASNEPFHSVNELTVGVNAFLRIPSREHNAWLFSLSYSPTAELNFPLPGVAYLWAPSEQFRMNIGLPFMVWYRPTEDLTLEASYMLLTTIHARATYRVCQPVRVYLGFDWANQSWFIVPRPDDKDRLFYYEKRLSVGAVTNIGHTFVLDVSTGYVFDRFYFEGQHYSDRHFNRVDIDGAPMLSFQAQLRW
jgi:hypothetical protein